MIAEQIHLKITKKPIGKWDLLILLDVVIFFFVNDDYQSFQYE